MNPAELQQQIAEQASQIDSLKDTITQIGTQLTTYISQSAKLNNLADTKTVQTINSIVRQNKYQITTTVTAGFILMPQSEYILVKAGSAVTSSTATAISNGTYTSQILYLEGTDDTNTVKFKDTANTNLSADITLGKGDTLSVIWNGKVWNQLSTSNN